MITYCNIMGGWSGEGNIDADPLFIGAGILDYNLCLHSPCIDAGDPSMQDADGSRADIGVFYPEHPDCKIGRVLHVSTAGDDMSGDGSQATPFQTIQHGIDVARTTDTVLVQCGVYYESIDIVYKNICLRSCTSDWGMLPAPEHTIIDGQSAASVIRLVGCDGATTLDGFTITNGRAANGGGILCQYTSAAITNSIIRGNEAADLGGGIHLSDSRPVIAGCLIEDNSAVKGGGICCESSDATIIGNTLSLNSASEGGGIHCDASSSPTIENTICWFNSAGRGPEIYAPTGSSPVVSYCDILGGWDGEGNIDRNPLFAAGPTGHNVCSESPCIDAGDPAMVDPDGSRADIGVFYPDHPECFARNVLRVSMGGDDQAGDGSAMNPFGTIQHAIDVSAHGDTVLVESGTYKENINFKGKCIAVLGVGAHLLSAAARPEVLRATIDGGGSGSVVRFEGGEDSTAVLARLTVKGGHSSDDGAGIHCHRSSPTIRGNIITENEGSGIHCRACSPIITGNVIKHNNHLCGNGGGIHCRDSDALIIDNIIDRNWASELFMPCHVYGGGVYCRGGSPVLADNVISRNASAYRGGGVSFHNSAVTLVGNTIFANRGGGIYCSGSSVRITNSIIWANGIETRASSIWATYCDIAGGWPGTGNIDGDPLFIDARNGNFNICQQSPCLDAGDPDMTDPDGSRADIGVFHPEHPECFVGNVLHVSTLGSDIHGEGSHANPFRTIQRGIDASVYGDTVIVHRGTYEEGVKLSFKDIVLASNHMYSADSLDVINTIITHPWGWRILDVTDCGSTAVIWGFTITGGVNSYYGPVVCERASPVIANNIITLNRGDYGAGIYLRQSAAAIIDNTIARNGDDWGWRGGIYCSHSNPSIIGNFLSRNEGDEICIDGTWKEDLETVIRDNYIAASGPGAAISCQRAATILIAGNLITSGTSYPRRGIVCDGQTNPTIIGNTVAGNWSGIQAWSLSPVIRNNIVVNSTSGCGISCGSESNPVIGCNNVWNNAGGNYEGLPDQTGSNGNICEDPLFCGPYNAQEPYTLLSESPCAPAQQPECGLIGALGVGCRAPVPAALDFEPDVLNPGSGGRWVTCYIELPEAYDPEDIDVSTVALNYTVPARESPTEVGDYDEDGVLDRMVKFSLSEVIVVLPDVGSAEVRVSGQVAGEGFEGADTIRVLTSRTVYFEGGESQEVTGLDEPPPCFAFHGCSPNPLRQGTSVGLDLPERRYVRLTIHDVKGRLVRALVDTELPPRSHSLIWDGRDASGREVSGGVYFVRLEAGPNTETAKVVVAR
jgi:parallel beta-helix repeat protein